MSIYRNFAALAAAGACVLAALPARADRAKLSGTALMMLECLNDEPAGRADQRQSVLVSFDREPDRASLEAEGRELLSLFPGRGEWFAVLSMPMQDVLGFSDREDVTELSMAPEANLMLNNATHSTGVNTIHSGDIGIDDASWNVPYTGRGVVAGIVDSGLDPGHINFEDADGVTRIARYWRIVGSIFTEYSDPAKVRKAPTDNESTSHATHVAGILGGAYDGKGTFGIYNQNTGKSSYGSDLNNPYSGVATGATLALATGNVAPANVVAAIDRIMTYAESQDMPAVVNISLGVNNDGHDGTSVTERAIEALGQRGIIVISSGNEANERITIAHTLDGEKPLRTLIDLGTNKASNYFELWSDGLEELDLALTVVNAKTGEEVYRRAITAETWSGIATAQYTNDYFAHPAAFTNYFNGAYRAFTRPGESNPERRMYYFNTVDLAYAANNQNGASFKVGLSVNGPAGTRVWLYGSQSGGTYIPFTAGSLADYTEGNGDASINTLACARNTIAVGSYSTSRNVVTLNNNSFYYPTLTTNSISPFSSYGELIDGRKLPHICAPGSVIMSSLSRKYVTNVKLDRDQMVGEVTVGSNTYHWGPMQGTSMSAPFAAGVVALWLEADPSLKYDDVVDIMQTTALRDARVKTAKNQVQWGAGKLDPLAGLKEVITRRIAQGVGSVAVDAPDIIIEPSGEGWLVTAPGRDLTVTVADLNGRTVAQAAGNGTATARTAYMAPGIYLLTAATPAGSVSRKIAVR